MSETDAQNKKEAQDEHEVTVQESGEESRDSVVTDDKSVSSSEEKDDNEVAEEQPVDAEKEGAKEGAEKTENGADTNGNTRKRAAENAEGAVPTEEAEEPATKKLKNDKEEEAVEADSSAGDEVAAAE